MTELTVFQHDAVDVVDSRQVAEMTGKQHKHLLRDIAGYIEVLTQSTEPKIGPSDFFIESSYKDSTGRAGAQFPLQRVRGGQAAGDSCGTVKGTLPCSI